MALDYSLHKALRDAIGRSPSLPSLPAIGGQQALALGTTSDEIIGPCELCLVPGEKVRLDIRTADQAGSLNPAGSFIVLPAATPSWFHIDAGSWKIKAAAA
ncbi:hypothetical protein KRZ98_06165 [Sphingobium sp. AS12]|uniref:hypothetical protein n=1 Tax=Sphingobium sp. AS12 TaxID=2849495 RepID=UPI001C3142AF|nr:hypothetical protein [Sphingobium sp. AS12]MBV2147874.1 hypothetical protein [Sphingobium sp. AS12]